MARYDQRAIANEILKRAWKRDLKITKMHLIKLVFLVHGWSLAFFDEPLVDGQPQVWKLGPVYPKLYNALSGYTSQPVNKLLTDEFMELPYAADDLALPAKRLITNVVDSYGKMHAFSLSDLTHKDGSPWATTLEDSGNYASIPEATMKEYYNNVRKERGWAKNTFD
ncbi:type II toxin-antitoxin system antitoxin SocA domain-containing protein [Mesorhizobium sp. M0159]|uniref:Panacea domain-containing protein n=1 Tax=Mesorhizobium sp. M0159 TaxID=2956900 RepID=UPI00333ABC85